MGAESDVHGDPDLIDVTAQGRELMFHLCWVTGEGKVGKEYDLPRDKL